MTPLVLVHGFMGGSQQWLAQAPLEEVCPVVALDLPGFGLNAGLAPFDTIERYAHWVISGLDARGISQCHLLGHSMGGMIAQEVVRLAPERVNRLILHSTGAIGALPGRFEPIEVSQQRAAADGVQATARRISATWFRDGVDAPGYEACATIAEQASPASLQAGLEAMRTWSGETRLGAIRAPTLVLWGDSDRTYPWAQTQMLWQGIERASLAVVPDSGHAVHAERSDLFNAILSGFVDGTKVQVASKLSNRLLAGI